MVIDSQAVRQWISQAEAECALRARDAEAAAYQLAESKRRLALLHELLATVASGGGIDPNASAPELMTSERVERDVVEVLKAHGTAMRIQDIHTEFVRRRFALPGRGAPTNIVAHLTKSTRVKRVARGVYALVDQARGSDPRAKGAA